MERSMMGSGIYSSEVSYDECDGENDECEQHNEAGETATDDYGSYTIECVFCGYTHRESSLSEDRDDYFADYDPNN